MKCHNYTYSLLSFAHSRPSLQNNWYLFHFIFPLISSAQNFWYAYIFLEEKLKNHLDLVRQEYVKFQQKWVDLKEKYDVAVAAQGEQGEDNFVAKLLAFVADLFDKDIYRWAQKNYILEWSYLLITYILYSVAPGFYI